MTGKDTAVRPLPEEAPVSLVIFDCDGVLVDSEPISVSVLLEVLREAGCEISLDDGYDRLLGRSIASISDLVRRDFGVALTETHLADMRARLYERFREELKPVAGIAETVAALGKPICVASSSQPERIRLSLSVTGLIGLFEPNIFSATMVENGKPAPDLFLHAAARMGVAPEECVVVEDSPAGIEAARRAGMRVIAFCGGGHAGPARLREQAMALSPSALIENMQQLGSVLETL